MISRYERHGLVWLDAHSPTEEEKAHIKEEFALDDIDGALRSIDTLNHKLHFAIGPRYLITIRHADIDAISRFAKAFEKDTVSDRSQPLDSGQYIFAQMMSELHNQSLQEINKVPESSQKCSYLLS
jgi:Mg2+ and Co2+ transporter CorA